MRSRQWRLAPCLIALLLVAGACTPAAPAPSPTAAKPAAAPTRAAAAPTAAAPAATGAAAAPTAAAAGGKPFVFGIIVDRSGTSAYYSSQVGDGMAAAIKQINSQGGILGRQIEARYENNQDDPNQTVSLVRKLIQGGANIVLLQSGSAAVLQGRVPLTEEKVVGIAPLAAADAIAQPPNNDYIFQMNAASSLQIEANAKAMQAAGYKRIAVFKETIPTADNYMKIATPVLEQAGVTIITTESAPSDVTDATPYVIRMRDSKPDAVFVEAPGGKAEVAYFKAALQLGWKPPTFDPATIGASPDLWDLAAPEAYDGLIYPSQLTMSNPATVKANDVLSKEVPNFKALTYYMVEGYDGPFLAKKAIETAGGATDGPTLKKALESIQNFPLSWGGTGLTLSYSPTKHAGVTSPCAFVMVTMKGNRPGDLWPKYQPKC